MINDIKRGPIANSIALHDCAISQSKIKNWFEYIVKFFKDNNILPTRIGITGDLYSKSKSTILFKNGMKRLYDNNFESLESITIEAWDLNENTICFVWFELNVEKQDNTFLLSFDDQSLGFDKTLIDKLARDLAGFCTPKYGYSYRRKWVEGPYWYPFGVISGLDDGDPEEEKIAKWARKYCRPDGSYKIGDLRDIYPMNVLSQVHLDRIVLGSRLEDWILQNPIHGTLTKLTDNLWAWWVEETQIPHVLDALAPTGIILCI